MYLLNKISLQVDLLGVAKKNTGLPVKFEFISLLAFSLAN